MSNHTSQIEHTAEQHTNVNIQHEQVLSQKLSQLSCSQPSDQIGIEKLNRIPWYLSNKNESHEKLINELYFNILSTATSVISSTVSMQYEQDLRQITILTHKIKSLQLVQLLWITYLKSGTGQLHMNETGPSVWPIQITTIVKKIHGTTVDENTACMQLVQERLHKFSTKIKQNEVQLEKLKHRLQDDKQTIIRTIETFVHENQENFRQSIEHKMKLVQYDYHDRVLELQFLEQNPSEYCIKLYKHLYNAQYKDDITKEEVLLLKERISRYKKNNAQHHQRIISQLPFIRTGMRQFFQQQIDEDLTSAFEQAKTDMLTLYTNTAENQMNTYDKVFNKELDKLLNKQIQENLPMQRQFTAAMLHLLEERIKNRKERIKCLYEYKIHCLHKDSFIFKIKKKNTKKKKSKRNNIQGVQREQKQQPALPQHKKCHGNRSDQRFRQNCRKKNMNEADIAQLIEQRRNVRRNNPINDTQNNSRIISVQSSSLAAPELPIREPIVIDGNAHRTTTTVNNKTMQAINKRKQDVVPTEAYYNVPKSSSQLSFCQAKSKKIKKKKKKKKKKAKNRNSMKTRRWRRRIQNAVKNEHHRQLSSYLKISWYTLMQNVKKHLKHPLKKRMEQKFVYVRLCLFDEEYRLNQNQSLFQAYLDHGLQQQQRQVWPMEICEMIKTDEPNRCKQYIEESLNKTRANLQKCHSKLNEQAKSWITTLPSLYTLDENLKQFVALENKYLSNKMNKQLAQYKSILDEHKKFQQILLYMTSSDQILVNELINIQKQQIQLMDEFIKFEQQILCNVLPHNFNSLDRLIPYDIYRPLLQDTTTIEFNNESTRIIQQLKRTCLNIYYKAYETQLQQYEEQYMEHLHQLQLQFEGKHNIHNMQALSSIKTYLKDRKERSIQQIHANMSDCRRNIRKNHRRSSKTNNTIEVSPKPVFYLLNNPFNKRERDYLAKGPNYVRINQSAVQSYKKRKQIISKEHENILKKVRDHLLSYHRVIPTAPIYNIYSEKLQYQLNLRYMASLSIADGRRARQEKDVVKSICSKLKQHKLLIRITDKSGVFCVLQYKDHEQKAMEYREKTKAYERLSYNPFQEASNKVVRLLNDLHAKQKKLRAWQYNKMIGDIKKSKLSYMYFNPKTHKNGTPFRPIMHTIKSPTSGISSLLDQLIRPIFNEKAAATNILDGTHLIKRLHQYAIDGHLNSNTLFCTFDINNLYTMLPQEESLNILVEFLQTFDKQHVQGIDIATLRELARIVIEENVFIYRNKYYRQIIGGAMGSPFTLTLANVFMWKWERESICKQLPSTEMYGRYIDDIFFTWNDTREKLEHLLETLNHHHPNIKLDYKIGQCLPFLDVLLSNVNGTLTTCVYRKPAAEPYVIPYSSDHPRHIFKNIIRGALLRALRYSSTFEAFNIERRNIRLMLLYNGYPVTYINRQLRNFLKEYNSYSSYSSILPIMTNENDFVNIRQKIMPLPTRRQSQVAAQIAYSQVEYYDNNKEHQQLPILSFKNQDKKQRNFKLRLFQHHIYENRLRTVKRDIHEIYESTFQNTYLKQVNLIVGCRLNQKLKRELIKRKCPPKALRRPTA